MAKILESRLQTATLKKIQVHHAFRLLGISLFLMGLVGFITAGLWVNQDRATWHLLLWTFGATMTGLATFGHHNENAVAWMMQGDQQLLSPSMKAELTEEIQHDRAGTLAAQPTTKLAIFITLFAVSLQIVAVTKIWRLL
jgi:hypothetical protein